jgi:molecular chaperone HscA
VEQSIEVKPQYGLTDAEVEKMLLDSMTHAREDMKTRSVVEAKTEAEQLIATTNNFMEKNKSFLTEEEIRTTTEAIANLESILNSSDKDAIHAKIEALNELSRPYAERVMDIAVAKAMSGKKISDNL